MAFLWLLILLSEIHVVPVHRYLNQFYDKRILTLSDLYCIAKVLDADQVNSVLTDGLTLADEILIRMIYNLVIASFL